MVNLHAARHRLPVPALARWLLMLGIVATLATNMAQGWSHGPVGAVIAAWPAVSLVGSYDLLVWIIRTAAAGELDRVLAADQRCPLPDHADTGPQPAPGSAPDTGNAAAVAAYRASVQDGQPMSERMLAEKFGIVQLNQGADRPALAVILNGNPAVIAARLAARGRHSRFERQPCSSQTESSLYADTAARLAEASWRVCTIDITTRSADEAAMIVTDRILALRADANPEQP
jgi:hypothetical protein